MIASRTVHRFTLTSKHPSSYRYSRATALGLAVHLEPQDDNVARLSKSNRWRMHLAYMLAHGATHTLLASFGSMGRCTTADDAALDCEPQHECLCKACSACFLLMVRTTFVFSRDYPPSPVTPRDQHCCGHSQCCSVCCGVSLIWSELRDFASR